MFVRNIFFQRHADIKTEDFKAPPLKQPTNNGTTRNKQIKIRYLWPSSIALNAIVKFKRNFTGLRTIAIDSD